MTFAAPIFTDLDTVFIAIKSVTLVSKNVAQMRFTKSLQHGSVVTDTPAIATVTYDTTDTPTTEQQRFKNPLGLEVQTYPADLEVIRIATGDKIAIIQVRNQQDQRVREVTQEQVLQRGGRSR